MQNGSRADFFLLPDPFFAKNPGLTVIFSSCGPGYLFFTRLNIPSGQFFFFSCFLLRFYIKVNASHTAVQINRSHSPGIRDFVASAEIGIAFSVYREIPHAARTSYNYSPLPCRAG